MKQHHSSRRLFKQFIPMLGVIFLALALSPGQASAQTSKKLSDYISYQEQVVVGVNVDKLRKSKYFQMVADLAQGDSGAGDMMSLLNDAGVDFTTDITALTVGVSSLDVQKSLQERKYSVVISGKFDPDKLVEALKSKKVALKSSKLGKRTLYTADNIAFTFPEKGVLFVTSGPDAYRTRALSALNGSDKSVTKSGYFKRISKGLDTSRGVWLIANAASDPSASAGGPNQANEIAMSLDLSSGLVAEILIEMATKKGAAETVEMTQAQAKLFVNNPMVAMTGAKPLLTNLKIAQTGTRVSTTTQLTSAELDLLVQRAGSMIKSQIQKQTGTTPAPAGKASAPAGKVLTPTDKASAPEKKIKADFN